MHSDSIKVGCGYCMTCGYGGEPSPLCLHSRTFVPDPESSMPMAVQGRHAELNHAARECYRLRDEAEQTGDMARGRDFLTLGDDYFLRSLAISAEWEESA